jgi:peptidoglycan/LPS O-acetylase OafA/YrhL
MTVAKAPREENSIASDRGRRGDIQGLRAVAVLLVIADHAGIPGLSGGFIGVDVFFVISGYVITQLLLREAGVGVGQGLADFYSRRVRRIAPAATATLIATLIAAQLAMGGHIDPNLPGDIRWASLFTMNLRLIRTGSDYFIPGIQPSLITQFWSLAVEEQFYVVYPLIVLLTSRLMPPTWRLRLLSGVVGVGVVLSAVWSIHLTRAEPLAAYYSPFTRFWELGLGCLVAIVTARSRPPRHGRQSHIHPGRLAASAGALLLIVSLLTLDSKSAYPGWLAWLPCGGAALIIWGGISGSSIGITALLSRRPLTYIGNLSYSLYLTHYAWLNLPEQLLPPVTGWEWRVLELAGTGVTAVLSYHLLENPLRHWRRLAADRVAAGLLLCVCIASAWGAAAVVSHLSIPG